MSFTPAEARYTPLPDIDRLRSRALMVGVVGLVACGFGFVLDFTTLLLVAAGIVLVAVCVWAGLKYLR